MPRKIAPETKAAILSDYAAGMSAAAVGAKHGLSAASVHRYTSAAGISRSHARAKAKAKARREAELVLTGGRWVIDQRRRIQVWEAW